MKPLNLYVIMLVSFLCLHQVTFAELIISNHRAGSLHAVDATGYDIGPVLSVTPVGSPAKLHSITWITTQSVVADIDTSTGRATQLVVFWDGLNCSGNAYVPYVNLPAFQMAEDYLGNPFMGGDTASTYNFTNASGLYPTGCTNMGNLTMALRPISYVTVPHYPFVAPVILKVK